MRRVPKPLAVLLNPVCRGMSCSSDSRLSKWQIHIVTLPFKCAGDVGRLRAWVSTSILDYRLVHARIRSTSLLR